MDTLQVVDTHSIPQERLKDSVVQADTLLYTLRQRVQHSARHTCTPAFTSSPSTRVRFWSSSPAPTYDAETKTSLKLEMERRHWGKKKEGRAGISCYILLRDFFFFLADKDSL